MADQITSESTLGDMAEILAQWKDVGMTRSSVLYAISRVWWEEPDLDSARY